MFGLRPTACVLVFVCFACADKMIIVENAPPEIEVLETCYDEGLPMIRIKLSDQESDVVDLGIRGGESGDASWILPGPRGVGLVGLATSPTGRTHLIQWGPCPTSDGPCSLPSAVTALEPEFVGDCQCANPPTDGTFPSSSLRLMGADGAGEARVTIDTAVFSEAPCAP